MFPLRTHVSSSVKPLLWLALVFCLVGMRASVVEAGCEGDWLRHGSDVTQNLQRFARLLASRDDAGKLLPQGRLAETPVSPCPCRGPQCGRPAEHSVPPMPTAAPSVLRSTAQLTPQVLVTAPTGQGRVIPSTLKGASSGLRARLERPPRVG